ncbi:anthranilate synthase [Striga asiatica]|uniref:Anthranilate synthase n=1 Tax=Striga asiatica TaxID=4170 RepID=A0A5A7P247_STRAF|nr:anthranilate synthase [Striga asiatica]
MERRHRLGACIVISGTSCSIIEAPVSFSTRAANFSPPPFSHRGISFAISKGPARNFDFRKIRKIERTQASAAARATKMDKKSPGKEMLEKWGKGDWLWPNLLSPPFSSDNPSNGLSDTANGYFSTSEFRIKASSLLLSRFGSPVPASFRDSTGPDNSAKAFSSAFSVAAASEGHSELLLISSALRDNSCEHKLSYEFKINTYSSHRTDRSFNIRRSTGWNLKMREGNNITSQLTNKEELSTEMNYRASANLPQTDYWSKDIKNRFQCLDFFGLRYFHAPMPPELDFAFPGPSPFPFSPGPRFTIRSLDNVPYIRTSIFLFPQTFLSGNCSGLISNE